MSSRFTLWSKDYYTCISFSGKKKKALTNITLLASATLSKAAFLCSVLLEEMETWHLAFKVGMFVLEMPRPPASCKALEVRKQILCELKTSFYLERLISYLAMVDN